MKRLLYIIVIILTTFSLYALDDVSEALIKHYTTVRFVENNNSDTIRTFLEAQFKGDDIQHYDLFHYMFTMNKIDFVIPFIRAYNRYFPDKNYSFANTGFWRNPLSLAIEDNRLDLAKDIILIAPNLVNMENLYGGQGDGGTPLSNVIYRNNIALAKLMIPYLKDVNKQRAVGSMHHSNYQDLGVNFLSLSQSKEMDELLINAGVKSIGTKVMVPESYVLEDKVRLRSGPGINFSILLLMNKNQKLTIKAYTYKYFEINGKNGRWIKVQVGNLEGWVFEPYIYIWVQ